ncbi:MAG: 4Fe-4S binding protein [Succiniclasticum sp.]|nr:4Fe-4S binding protein [Succiniclasticum sp.]MEE3479259.1 4Fe-4S binding protein [Succiniclasticum sp.]
MTFPVKRWAGYVFGFILFYAPFALFQRGIGYLLTGKWMRLSIHTLCLRIPTEHLLDGRFGEYGLISVVSTLILFAAAFFFGPVFCGKLCPAGAFSELISKIVPERFQISWGKYTEIAPIRYGMLAGYLLVPFSGEILACNYCNYFVFDLLANQMTRGYYVAFSTSLLLTGFLWLVVFGLFTKGGRGFCNFLCPVGAIQSIIHYAASKLPFTWRRKVDTGRCIGCSKCVHSCPVDAMRLVDHKASPCLHNCIECGVCSAVCPVHAVHYGRGDHHEK